ncbi:MAG: ABC transporter permease [Chloroflexi bacterium]|nr:ABC transporter permease [Chloroflexota bacterium]
MNQSLTTRRASNWIGEFDLQRWILKHIQYILIPIALTLFLIAWQTVVTLNRYPVYILPTPGNVAESWIASWQRGILPRHLGITLFEIALGFGIAFAFASTLGYVLAKSPLIEKIVSPYLVAAQAVPLVAIGPLIIIWIDTGIAQNALIAALIIFFPMLINTIVGVRSVREEYRALMRSYNASAWQVFTILEMPAALAVFFGCIRVGITLSVIGVIVVELMWADRGLGFLLNFATKSFDTPLVFATVITLSALALGLYIGVAIFERRIIRWRR